MYIPNWHREDRLERLHEVMRDNPFAPIVTTLDGSPFATHLPFLLDAGRGPHGTLRAHLARPNPQWKGFAPEVEALVIFQGPHAFVSPRWYTVQPAVPTWNYAVVHAYGRPRIVDDAALRAILQETVSTFDGEGPEHPLPDDYFDKMMRGVVGFEMEIDRIEGKFKMSQNRSEEDQRGVIRSLSDSERPGDRETAQFMDGLIEARREAR